MNSQELKYLRDALQRQRHQLIALHADNRPEPAHVKGARETIRRWDQERCQRRSAVVRQIDELLTAIELKAILAGASVSAQELLQELRNFQPQVDAPRSSKAIKSISAVQHGS